MPQVLTQAAGTASGPSNLNFSEYELEPIGADKILIKFHAAPINPLDMYVLKGMYPVKPQHQYRDEPILGFDGVGEVVERGEAVKDLSVGDFVVPKDYGMGTWRSHAVLEGGQVQKIPRPHDLTVAAILKLGVLPAYLLVEDMTQLKPGDWIILNAATSVIAQFVIQFAHRRGAHTISMIRDRDPQDVPSVKKALMDLGADLVLTEAEVASETATLKNKRIVLALDSVFGNSGQLLLKNLMSGGTFVQLGMLGGPAGKIELSTGDLFARQITLRSFRGSAQWAIRSAQEQLDLLGWLVTLFNTGQLVLPTLGLKKVVWDTSDVHRTKDQILAAVGKVEKGAFGQRKVIMVFESRSGDGLTTDAGLSDSSVKNQAWY